MSRVFQLTTSKTHLNLSEKPKIYKSWNWISAGVCDCGRVLVDFRAFYSTMKFFENQRMQKETNDTDCRQTLCIQTLSLFESTISVSEFGKRWSLKPRPDRCSPPSGWPCASFPRRSQKPWLWCRFGLPSSYREGLWRTSQTCCRPSSACRRSSAGGQEVLTRLFGLRILRGTSFQIQQFLQISAALMVSFLDGKI